MCKVKCKSNSGSKSYFSGWHTGLSPVPLLLGELWHRFQWGSSLISVLHYGNSVLLSPGGKGLKRCTCHCNRLIIAGGAGRLARMPTPLPTTPAGREAWGLCSLRLNDSQLPQRRSLQPPPILSSRFTDSLSAHDKWQNHPEPPPPH